MSHHAQPLLTDNTTVADGPIWVAARPPYSIQIEGMQAGDIVRLLGSNRGVVFDVIREFTGTAGNGLWNIHESYHKIRARRHDITGAGTVYVTAGYDREPN